MHQRLKQMRALSGMTQKELADSLGYVRVQYSYIETGARPMPPGFYERAVSKMLKHCEDKVRLLRAENDRC
jgi:DNA-binding XRE family transcriptional regulator